MEQRIIRSGLNTTQKRVVSRFFVRYVNEYYPGHGLTRHRIISYSLRFYMALKRYVIYFIDRYEHDARTIDLDNDDLHLDLLFDDNGNFNFGARIDLDIYLNTLLDEFVTEFIDNNIPNLPDYTNNHDENGEILIDQLQTIVSFTDIRMRRAFDNEDEINEMIRIRMTDENYVH